MKKILVIGAGLSSSTLIQYLLDHSEKLDWKVKVGDVSLETAKRKIGGHKNGSAIEFDIFNEVQREKEISNSDLTVSMLPARFHYLVAECCVKFKKDMVTASYVSPEMKALAAEAEKAGIMIMNEIGVDPGIDHMSAMLIIDRIKEQGGKLTSFQSYTGGLVAPKYDNNPWNYKFTWNPRNVVLAGAGGSAQIIENGKYKFIPYHQLFKRTSLIEVLNYGEFEVYCNRDSLKYRKPYNIEDIPTMIRGTMRRPGFSKAWDSFVQLGATDDSFVIENSENMTYREFINTFLDNKCLEKTEKKLAKFLKVDLDSEIMYKLRWLGIFKDTKIELKHATPAQILQKILEEKWQLDPEDKDLIAMQHIFEYEKAGKIHKIKSSLVVEGRDAVHTAMSITVGVPVAIAVKMILTGVFKEKGVHIPVTKNFYLPVLEELKSYGIRFVEEEIEI
jgi:saccharopine dehydrogenase-like NADP-dependent oxidoreductase